MKRTVVLVALLSLVACKGKEQGAASPDTAAAPAMAPAPAGDTASHSMSNMADSAAHAADTAMKKKP
jgi:hypothetical protein